VELDAGDIALPPGYRASTEALVGVAPMSNISYVTQWQVWHKPFVLEMLREIEERVTSAGGKARWPEAVLVAAAASGQTLSFSEYTLYATWLLKRHPRQVQLVSSSDFAWLRDPPSGVLDSKGECCPSEESLCQVQTPCTSPRAESLTRLQRPPPHPTTTRASPIAQARLGGFNLVSWECLHADARRDPSPADRSRRSLMLSPGPAPPPSPSSVPTCEAAGFNLMSPVSELCGPGLQASGCNRGTCEANASPNSGICSFGTEFVCICCYPSTVTRAAPPPPPPPCGTETCTEAVLNTYAPAAYSDTMWGSQRPSKCGDRIEWLQTNLGLSEAEACRKVARREYPVECGGCSPPGWPK